MSSYFFTATEKNTQNALFLSKLEEHADKLRQLIFVLDRPLGDKRYTYKYSKSLIILIPKHKICILDYGNDEENGFEDYVDDIIEDLASISDRYLYKDIIGRVRSWRANLVDTDYNFNRFTDIPSFLEEISLEQEEDFKKVDLLISLFIGSINDIQRVKIDVPKTTLDKVKQKIQLFDGDQTRFVYQKPQKKKIRIQGLSGTGKTELLLHKLKDIYVSEGASRIFFTCHNKILADNLRKRIPSFFNFMKVEQQIEWEKRLWCTNAWGSKNNVHSGVYRYICSFYDINFSSYSPQMPFSKVCSLALHEIKIKNADSVPRHAFDYMFIDESQDFNDSFIELCDFVTSKNIYIAGDIFQSIFDEKISSSIEPDFLLGKCYRTDPKTLMFAHALGMGLFESTKLRWLGEKEWKDCGYNVVIDDKRNFVLSREPMRRFEDVGEDYDSMEITIASKLSESVVGIIQQIKIENPTVVPDDIGVIFLDQGNAMYTHADLLEYAIQVAFQWNINKAYESKEKIPGSLLISNRNNVKGLEFPFVICISQKINSHPSYRNALYTMLTRSFIKSYFVLPNTTTSGLTEEMSRGLDEILRTKKMTIKEPNVDEKTDINTRFEYEYKSISHYDLMMKIFGDLKIDEKYHARLFSISQEMNMLESEEDVLKEFIAFNFKFINTI